jgi:hypothetical protein
MARHASVPEVTPAVRAPVHHTVVIPAKAGTHVDPAHPTMGPGFRRDDGKE